ncbi:MAG TPA: RecQ family ATP-dependent DNA helicase [Anaerolineaceae bacterium]|nr:RecQ family ATP-dependent DNA helicase [Anaerolineaceae bacterium]
MEKLIDITRTLVSCFGFSGFRPGQAEAVQSLLNSRHTLVVMPTGSGKSLVFQLAALHLPGLTLVISPLIALMKDQVDSLAGHGISATFINSTLTASEQNQRLKGLQAGDYRIVYIAPERLRSTQFLNALQHQEISLLAVDEAHCISEWGHDFRPDYLHIAQFRAAAGYPLTAALTATATPQVQEDISRLLALSPIHRVVTGFNRPNLALGVHYVADPAGRLKALQELLAGRDDDATIIYTGTRRDAEEVAEFVNTVVGLKTLHYHAGLLPDERTRIQDEFIAGDLPVIAATNAFGMGIDRSDVRQVIHYSLPGSLEAYYQEAGRAGRDELPARAVLLYSPDDRSLQEWFIENSAITVEDLRLLFQALRSIIGRQKAITTDDLSCLSGMQAVKVRVGLEELERAAAIEHLGDDGMRMRFKLHEWKDPAIQAAIERHQQHQAHRKAQLERMIAYAESNDCRRRLILKHFGDTGPAEAEICCDNCQARQPAPAPVARATVLTQSERTALIVLDTVRRLPHNVGKEKIVQILRGSKAKDISQFGYDRSTYYGRLADLPASELKQVLDQLLEMKYLKVIGGTYPVLRLTPHGERAIQDKTAIPLKALQRLPIKTQKRKKPKPQVRETVETTAKLLSQGLSVEQVAAQRGLAPNTIYDHAAKLIKIGQITLDVAVPKDVQIKVEAAISQIGSIERLYPIKLLLPDELEYNIIRCVVENHKREQTPRAENFKSPHNQEISPQSEDPIAAFLSRSHPRQLPGPWDAGWALGFHSQFTGADWKRSDAGELAYRLKYQADLSTLPALVEQAAALIAEHPELVQADAIVPAPPSTPRPNDPVSSFAKAISQRFGLPFWPILVKSRQTAPQKEMHTLAQKRMNVAGAFDLQAPVKGKRLLVVDDLFDSGATLEEITRLLRRADAKRVCVLTMTRTIHSDA